jgi:hypothetical protein
MHQNMLRMFWKKFLFVPALDIEDVKGLPKSRPAPFLPALPGGDSWRDFVEQSTGGSLQ